MAVFVDYQNAYMGARAAFGAQAHFTDGQIYPRRLGILVTEKGRAIDPGRELECVLAFRGEPSAKHSRPGQAACQRQTRFWNAQENVTAITRPLKYYPAGTDARGDRTYRVEEKGIDDLIALHMVMGAMRDQYDVAVLMSADTDLVPAMESVHALGKQVEVASWQSRGQHRARLTIASANIWCHWLTRQEYDSYLHDPTDYTQAQPGDPPAQP